MEINLIGVPMFYGCDNPGVEKGPDVLRNNGLAQLFSNNHKLNDLGNVKVSDMPSNKYTSNNKMKYLTEVLDINKELAERVYESLDDLKFPLIVGGDHALAIGSLAGSSKYYGQDLGVIWVDAHGDINTESTSPSGNIHGMPLAASMGIGNDFLINFHYNGIKIKPENVFILGARDLDEGEELLIKERNLNVWRMNDIKEKGLEKCLDEVLEKLSSSNIKNIHLSFDIDSLDPYFVPGTGTPVVDGLTLEGGKLVLKTLLDTKLIRSMDFVEFNPELDKDNTTLNNCIELLKEISNSL